MRTSPVWRETASSPLDTTALGRSVEAVVTAYVGDLEAAPSARPRVPLPLCAWVVVDGPVVATVVLSASLPLGRAAAARMLEATPEEVTAVDVDDVLGELANMVGGAVKAGLPQPSSLSLPSVTRPRPGPDGHDVLLGAVEGLVDGHPHQPLHVAVLEGPRLPDRRRVPRLP